MRQTQRWAIGGAVLVAAVAGRAEGAGFALREQSSTAVGNAFAGATAGADDLTYMFFNPAALGRVDGYAAAVSLSYAMPRVELQDASGTTVLGTPIPGRDEDDDIAGDALIPALYVAVPLGEQVRLGLGINSPFGLKTEYSDEWVGRYHAVDSELRTVNINPALAVKLTDWASVGFGAQIQYADGELSRAVDFGTIGAVAGIPGAVPAGQDGFVRLQGDDWAYGYNAGLLVEPVKGTRLGLAYRSEINHRLKGDADFTGDEAGVATALRAATGSFQDSNADLDLTTPATVSFGIHQDIGPRFALMAEAAWTDWSSFEELRIDLDGPPPASNTSEERWGDSWFFALGATWRPLDSLTLRTGVAYDESPANDRFRDPRVPDENRYWASFGLTWQPRPWVGLDLGYTHIWVNDSRVDLSAADTDGTFRGDLTAEYDSSIDVVTAGLRLRF